MHVNILSYTSGAATLMGTVRLDADGKMVTDGNLSDGVREVISDAYDRAQKRGKTPSHFLMTLPDQFTGALIRARLVREK